MKRPWLVKQRNGSDCGICCLAMVTNRPYEEVLQVVGDAYSPEDGMVNTPIALERLGYVREDVLAARNGFRVFDVDEDATPLGMHILFGRRAILSVPSLKTKGGWHLVYWTGQQLLDPGSNPDRNVYELAPRTLLLFRETFHI